MEQTTLEEYLPTIKKYANVCFRKLNHPTYYEIEDLVDEGIIVLCNTFKKFDSSRNIPFSAYLKYCLKIHFAGIVATSYNKIPSMYQTDKTKDQFDNQRIDPLTNPIATSHFISNFKKLTQDQLELLLFYLKPPEFITNELLKSPKKQITIIRKFLNISEYKERKIRCKMVETLLS